MKVIGYDRDGTLTGYLHDFGSNHPLFQHQQGLRLIIPIAQKINTEGGIIFSNQDGPSLYLGHWVIYDQMSWLLDKIPGLLSCVWSERADPQNSTTSGNVCWYLDRYQCRVFCHCDGRYRKPKTGMIEVAREMGYDVTHYVGDLAGRSDWGNGKDTDIQFSRNSGIGFTDVKDLLVM